MKQLRAMASIAVIAALLAGPAAWAQHDTEKEHAELAKALPAGKVSLHSALAASTREGKPISAKYEVEDGKLQLSVYTVNGTKFSEVIVDHTTGKIAKVEPITTGDDLTAAQSQAAAIAKGKRSLSAAIAEATKANKGFRAVSASSGMKDGHPVADITLFNGREWKTVSEKLD